MPANLPPEYFAAEERFRAAETTEEKIASLEELISTVPKHKGTDHLRADLRRKLAKLRESAAARKSGGRRESPYNISREGAAQIVVIGPANTGKSSLVRALTNAEPEVAEYPFTTRIPTPGMMPIDNVQVQLVDTPPLDYAFEEGPLISLIRRADLILLVIDLQADPIEQYEQMLARLEEHRIIPAQLRDEYPPESRLWFIPMLVLVNKTDDERHDEDFEVLCELLGEPQCPLIPISVEQNRNIERMKQAVFEHLGIIRVYSKPPGKEPDFSAPFVLKAGSTVEEFAGRVHRDFVEQLRSARVWGTGVYDGQMVGRDHVLHDGDIVELNA
ncbi:MAG TPA: TGS domain-containing protein [Aggregatilineales bacterium]|nr:TGS domain-containing protein [Aggregatilineales bacterium]